MPSQPRDKTVLLFYRDYECDKWVPGDRYLKRVVRPIYNRLTGRRPRVSGFLVAYRLLVEALRRSGYDVRLNDHGFARRNPWHPVGLFGYPRLLDGWKLPNPAVLGPGLYDHPRLAPRLMEDPRNRSYLVSSEWMRRLYARYYGDAVRIWFAGIDADRWDDTSTHPKDVDVLVYDKIYWDREKHEMELVRPILDRLERRGLRVLVLRYGTYDHEAYRQALSRSRSMLFLCANETQGLAYQEAMASNVPVIAWDQGYWMDPRRQEWEEEPVPASSVPYFSEECGERFRGLGEFDGAFERFWAGLDGYTPRSYVVRELSLEKSAEAYMACYAEAGAASA